jgi:hypothetical protein
VAQVDHLRASDEGIPEARLATTPICLAALIADGTIGIQVHWSSPASAVTAGIAYHNSSGQATDFACGPARTLVIATFMGRHRDGPVSGPPPGSAPASLPFIIEAVGRAAGSDARPHHRDGAIHSDVLLRVSALRPSNAVEPSFAQTRWAKRVHHSANPAELLQKT